MNTTREQKLDTLNRAAELAIHMGVVATVQFPFITIFDVTTVEKINDVARFVQSRYDGIEFDATARFETRASMGPSITGMIRS